MLIEGKENLVLFNLLQLKSALGLELKGLKHSRGSVYAYIKKRFGLSGNKQKVYDQFVEIIEQEKKRRESVLAYINEQKKEKEKEKE